MKIDWVLNDFLVPWKVSSVGKVVYSVVLPAITEELTNPATAAKVLSDALTEGAKYILRYAHRVEDETTIQTLKNMKDEQGNDRIWIEDYDIDTRPLSYAKILISADIQAVNGFGKISPLYPESLVNAGLIQHRISFETNQIKKKIKILTKKMIRYSKDIDKFTGEVLGINLREEARRLEGVLSALGQILSSNQTNDLKSSLSLDVKKTETIELGLNSNYEVIYVAYKQNCSENLVILRSAIEAFRAHESANPRTMSYLAYLGSIVEAPSLSWTDFLLKYTYPTPVILSQKGKNIKSSNISKIDKHEVGHLSDLVAELDSKPVKRGEQKLEEDRKIYDKDLKASVYRDLQSTADFVGSPIVGNLAKTIDSIADLPSLYSSVLNKMNLQDISRVALESTLKSMPKSDLELLESNYSLQKLGSNVDASLDELPTKIVPLVISLPELPVHDNLAALSIAIETSISDALTQALVETVKGVMITALASQGKEKEDYGSKNLNKMLSGDDTSGMTAPSIQPPLPQVHKALISLLGQSIDDTNIKDMHSMLNDISSLLTPKELCNLLDGGATSDVMRLVRSVTGTRYPKLGLSLQNAAVATDFFRIIGKTIPKPLCHNLQNILPETRGNRLICDDGSILDIRKKLLSDKKLSSEQIDLQLKKIRFRQIEKVKQLADLSTKPNETVQKIIDELMCPSSGPGLMPGMSDEMKETMGQSVSAVFQGVRTSFDREIEEFKDVTKQIVTKTEQIPMTIVVKKDKTGGLVTVENPEITALRALGEQIPLNPESYSNTDKKTQGTLSKTLFSENKKKWNKLPESETEYYNVKVWDKKTKYTRTAPDLRAALQQMESTTGKESHFSYENGAAGTKFILKAPISTSGKISEIDAIKGFPDAKKLLSSLPVSIDGSSFVEIDFRYPSVKDKLVLDDEYIVSIPNTSAPVYQHGQLLTEDVSQFVAKGNSWLGSLAVGGIDGEIELGSRSPQEIVWAKYAMNLWKAFIVKSGSPAPGSSLLLNGFKSYYSLDTFANITKDMLSNITKEIASSPWFNTAKVKSEKELVIADSDLKSASDKLNATEGTEINILDLAPFLRSPSDGCPNPKHLLDLDNMQKIVVDQQGDSCSGASKCPDVSNSLESSISRVSISVLLRLYAIEFYLQSIFVHSEFKPSGTVEPFLLDYLAQRLNEDLVKRFDINFQKQFYVAVAKEYALLVQNQKILPEDTLKFIQDLKIKKDIALAAAFEQTAQQPASLSPQASWDEFEDEIMELLQKDPDKKPYRALKEMIFVHWNAVAEDMESIVGSTSQESLKDRFLKKWIPLVPIAKTAVGNDFVVGAMESRFTAMKYDTKEEEIKKASYLNWLKKYLKEQGDLFTLSDKKFLEIYKPVGSKLEDKEFLELYKPKPMTQSKFETKFKTLIDYIEKIENDLLQGFESPTSQDAVDFLSYLSSVAAEGNVDENKVLKDLGFKSLPTALDARDQEFNFANGQLILEECFYVEYLDSSIEHINGDVLKETLSINNKSVKIQDVLKDWQACLRLSYIPPLDKEQFSKEQFSGDYSDSSVHVGLKDVILKTAEGKLLAERYKAFCVKEKINGWQVEKTKTPSYVDLVTLTETTDVTTNAETFMKNFDIENAEASKLDFQTDFVGGSISPVSLFRNTFVTPLVVVKIPMEMTLTIEEAIKLMKPFDESMLNNLYIKMKKEPIFKTLFDFCFPMQRFVSLMMTYCMLSFGKLYNISDLFAGTKQALKSLFEVTTKIPVKAAGQGINISLSADVGGSAPSPSVSLPGLGLGLGALLNIPGAGIISSLGDASVGKMLGKLALKTPHLILGGVVRQTDPNVGLAMFLSEMATLAGTNLPLFLASLLLLPCNVFPPPPFGPGIGPPITSLGFSYLASSAHQSQGDVVGTKVILDSGSTVKLPKSLLPKNPNEVEKC